jgi:hypothetical protein
LIVTEGGVGVSEGAGELVEVRLGAGRCEGVAEAVALGVTARVGVLDGACVAAGRGV